MPEQFAFDFKGRSKEEILKAKAEEMQREAMINEVLEWPEELQIEQYTQLIGQKPGPFLSDRQRAESIIDPEKERLRILAANRDEDNEETTRTYRR